MCLRFQERISCFPRGQEQESGLSHRVRVCNSALTLVCARNVSFPTNPHTQNGLEEGKSLDGTKREREGWFSLSTSPVTNNKCRHLQFRGRRHRERTYYCLFFLIPLTCWLLAFSIQSARVNESRAIFGQIFIITSAKSISLLITAFIKIFFIGLPSSSSCAMNCPPKCKYFSCVHDFHDFVWVRTWAFFLTHDTKYKIDCHQSHQSHRHLTSVNLVKSCQEWERNREQV